MIDETLAKLSRDLIAASDKLASEGFLKRQARFVEVEAERQSLAESLESDEAAVIAAQEALQAHFRNQMVTLPRTPTLACDKNTYGLQQGSQADDVVCANLLSGEVFVFGATDVDEFATARAPYNGAHSED